MRITVVDFQTEDLAIPLLILANRGQDSCIAVQEINSFVIRQLDTLLDILILVLRRVRIKEPIGNKLTEILQEVIVEFVLGNRLQLLAAIHAATIEQLNEALRGLPARSAVTSFAHRLGLNTIGTPRQHQLGRASLCHHLAQGTNNRAQNAFLKTGGQHRGEIIERITFDITPGFDRQFRHDKIPPNRIYSKWFSPY